MVKGAVKIVIIAFVLTMTLTGCGGCRQKEEPPAPAGKTQEATGNTSHEDAESAENDDTAVDPFD